MAIDIKVEARAHEQETVNLGEYAYQYVYPKVGPLLSALQGAQAIRDSEEKGSKYLDAMDEWLAAGFGPDQWAHIQARINSHDDPLDFKHMHALFDALFQKAADNRPPTWRGDSSAVSPQAVRREAVPSMNGLTPGLSPLGDSATS